VYMCHHSDQHFLLFHSRCHLKSHLLYLPVWRPDQMRLSQACYNEYQTITRDEMKIDNHVSLKRKNYVVSIEDQRYYQLLLHWYFSDNIHQLYIPDPCCLSLLC
jgi:hypothetical protein